MPNIIEDFAYIAKRLKELTEPELKPEEPKESENKEFDGEYPHDCFFDCA